MSFKKNKGNSPILTIFILCFIVYGLLLLQTTQIGKDINEYLTVILTNIGIM